MLERLPCANETLAILRTITGPDFYLGGRPEWSAVAEANPQQYQTGQYNGSYRSLSR